MMSDILFSHLIVTVVRLALPRILLAAANILKLGYRYFCSPCSPNKRRECTGKCRQFNGFGLVQTGSGPGGRWFKSTRPDHFFRISNLQHTKIRRAPGPRLGGQLFKSICLDHLSRLNQTLATISKTGSDLIFGPFGPTAALLDGSSKPKPFLPATSLRTATSYRILSYRCLATRGE